MRPQITWLAVGSIGTLLVLSPVARGQEAKVSLEKAPKSVIEAVKVRFKDAALTGASSETEESKTVYEVTIKDKGQNIDVTLTPEGEILLIEREITRKDLPKAVAKALADKYPKAVYKIVEEIIKVEKKRETLAYYEVLLVTAGKQALEVQVSAEGKILNEEKKGSGQEEK
ncbi:MAG: PepSY-like domain-containing protein [Acidobacteriota bacterium]